VLLDESFGLFESSAIDFVSSEKVNVVLQQLQVSFGSGALAEEIIVNLTISRGEESEEGGGAALS